TTCTLASCCCHLRRRYHDGVDDLRIGDGDGWITIAPPSSHHGTGAVDLGGARKWIRSRAPLKPLPASSAPMPVSPASLPASPAPVTASPASLPASPCASDSFPRADASFPCAGDSFPRAGDRRRERRSLRRMRATLARDAPSPKKAPLNEL